MDVQTSQQATTKEGVELHRAWVAGREGPSCIERNSSAFTLRSGEPILAGSAMSAGPSSCTYSDQACVAETASFDCASGNSLSRVCTLDIGQC